MKKFKIYLEYDPEYEGFIADVPSLPGCMSQGKTEKEALKNIPKYSVIKLADIIIVHRYFGMYENLSIKAMEELAKRRDAGEVFDFETYIEDNFNALPKPEFKIPDLQSIITNLGAQGLFKKR